jgi:hypothetical protein
MKPNSRNDEAHPISNLDNPNKSENNSRFELFDFDFQEPLHADEIATRVGHSRTRIKGILPQKEEGKTADNESE